MRSIRENDWVRVWETPAGQYVDSKYRTYECEASAEAVVIAWQLSSSAVRVDLEAALEFFPYRFGIRWICRHITVIEGEAVSERILSRWFGPESELRAETLKFLKKAEENPAHLDQQIYETPWFTCFWNGFTYRFVTDGKIPAPPTYTDFCKEYVNLHSRLHRDILTRFCGFEREV